MTAIRRVLVVDDDPDHTVALAHLLALRGWRAWRAHGGDEALAQLRRERVDAIVSDLALGGTMDGIALARQVRALPGPRVALVAYTGARDPHHRECALQAGFDVYVTKPASLAALLDALAQASRASNATAAPQPPHG